MNEKVTTKPDRFWKGPKAINEYSIQKAKWPTLDRDKVPVCLCYSR